VGYLEIREYVRASTAERHDMVNGKRLKTHWLLADSTDARVIFI